MKHILRSFIVILFKLIISKNKNNKYPFLVNDTTLPSANLLCFRKNLFEINI